MVQELLLQIIIAFFNTLKRCFASVTVVDGEGFTATT